MTRDDDDDDDNNNNNNNNYKIAVLGTAHILRKVLMGKYKKYFTGEITLHVAQIVKTEQLQHNIP